MNLESSPSVEWVDSHWWFKRKQLPPGSEDEATELQERAARSWEILRLTPIYRELWDDAKTRHGLAWADPMRRIELASDTTTPKLPLGSGRRRAFRLSQLRRLSHPVYALIAKGCDPALSWMDLDPSQRLLATNFLTRHLPLDLDLSFPDSVEIQFFPLRQGLTVKNLMLRQMVRAVDPDHRQCVVDTALAQAEHSPGYIVVTIDGRLHHEQLIRRFTSLYNHLRRQTESLQLPPTPSLFDICSLQTWLHYDPGLRVRRRASHKGCQVVITRAAPYVQVWIPATVNRKTIVKAFANEVTKNVNSAKLPSLFNPKEEYTRTSISRDSRYNRRRTINSTRFWIGITTCHLQRMPGTTQQKRVAMRRLAEILHLDPWRRGNLTKTTTRDVRDCRRMIKRLIHNVDRQLRSALQLFVAACDKDSTK